MSTTGGADPFGVMSGGTPMPSQDARVQAGLSYFQNAVQSANDKKYGWDYRPFAGYTPASYQTNNRYLRQETREANGNRKIPQFISAKEHEETWLRKWGSDPKWSVRLAQAAYRSGMAAENAKGNDFRLIWAEAGRLSEVFSALGRPMTPMQALEFVGGGRSKGVDWDSIGGGSGGGGGGGGYGGPRTVTNTSVNLSDTKTAKALTNAILSAYLGREATSDEVAAYRTALNAEERKNPTVTTTTISGDGSSQSSTTKGGLDSAGREQLLKDRALGTAEGQAYRTNDIFNQAMQYLAGM